MKFISLNFGRKTSLALLILLFLYYVPFSPVFFCTNEFYVKKVPVTLLISLILLLFLKEKLRIKLGLLLAIFRIFFVMSGIFGTIWFFCLPLIFSKLIDNIKSPPNVKEQFK